MTRPIVLVEPDGTWVMYYSGFAEAGQIFGTAIGRATAPAPRGPWTADADPVLEAGRAGAWDARFLFPDSVIPKEDGCVNSASLQVGRAVSTGGITWQKDADPVLSGEPGTWDAALAWGVHVQQTNQGWDMLYYGAPDTQGGPAINISFAHSEDGVTWQHSAENPVIDLVEQQAFFPSFVTVEDRCFVYYAVTTGEAYTEIHLAVSE